MYTLWELREVYLIWANELPFENIQAQTADGLRWYFGVCGMDAALRIARAIDPDFKNYKE